MQIYVDADACPVVSIVEEVAEKYRIDVTLLCDTKKKALQWEAHSLQLGPRAAKNF